MADNGEPFSPAGGAADRTVIPSGEWDSLQDLDCGIPYVVIVFSFFSQVKSSEADHVHVKGGVRIRTFGAPPYRVVVPIQERRVEVPQSPDTDMQRSKSRRTRSTYHSTLFPHFF